MIDGQEVLAHTFNLNSTEKYASENFQLCKYQVNHLSGTVLHLTISSIPSFPPSYFLASFLFRTQVKLTLRLYIVWRLWTWTLDSDSQPTQIQSEWTGQNTVIVLREPIADKNRLFKSPLGQQTELKTHSSLWRV